MPEYAGPLTRNTLPFSGAMATPLAAVVMGPKSALNAMTVNVADDEVEVDATIRVLVPVNRPVNIVRTQPL